MAERRRHDSIDTDKKDEVKLEVYDEDEYGQIDPKELREQRGR
jgi:hypothetical protein